MDTLGEESLPMRYFSLPTTLTPSNPLPAILPYTSDPMLTLTAPASTKPRPARRHFATPVLLTLLAVITACASLQSHAWLLDMCSHLRLPLLYTSSVLVLTSLFSRRAICLVVAATICATNAATILFALKEQPATAATSRTHVRLLQSNIWARNTDYPRLARFIAIHRPDIIAFEEYTRSTSNALHKLGISSNYPYETSCPSYDGGSENALFSRFPLSNIRNLQSSSHHDTTLVADTTINGTLITIAVLHPRSPMRETLYQRNCLQLETLAAHRNELGTNLLVLGDFNSTPYSWKISNFCSNANLRDTRPGWSPAPSWPALTPFLPIDFIFVSPSIHVDGYNVGPNNGSDHLPVVCDVSVP